MTKPGPVLTNRDQEVLTWIGDQYAATTEQIRFLMGRRAQGPTTEAGRVRLPAVERRMKRLEQYGVIEREKIFFNQPAWVYLTTKGLRLMSQPYRYLPPSLFDHLEAMNEVRLHIEGALTGRPDWQWHSERWLRYEWGLDEKRKNRHVPDAELVVDRLIAVEVELSRKSEGRLNKIFNDLASHYERIRYYVTEQSCGYVVDKISQHVKRDLFSVHLLEAVRLANLGQVDHRTVLKRSVPLNPKD
jgi:DNA-binding Lrp family transcriptional regulator